MGEVSVTLQTVTVNDPVNPWPQVRVRLEQFHANVNAVVDFYSDVKTEVDATDAPDKVKLSS